MPWPRVTIAVSAALTLCACPVALPAGSELDLACEEHVDCLDGFRCVEGRCVAIGQDAGNTDVEQSDLSRADVASADTAPPDSMLPDAGSQDAARPDAAQTDGSAADSALPDTAMPDSALPDSALPDTAMPDAACEDAGCWWDEAWGWRQRLTVDNRAHDEELVDFPLLVVLDETRIDYGVTHDSGLDLRFVADDQLTVLAHELEAWDETGRSFVWVKVPRIAAAADSTGLWLYYGHPSPGDPGPGREVWSDGFQAVYHLDRSVGDSSPNDFDATDHGAVEADGMIGGARAFDGASAYLDLGADRPFARDTGHAILSAWFNANETYDARYVVSVSVNNGGIPTVSSRAALGVQYYDFLIGGRADDGENWDAYVTSDDIAGTGTWYYVVAINDYVDERMRVYVDGVLRLDAFGDYLGNWSSDTNATCSTIGADDDGSRYFFEGVIDEVRIADVDRSAAWIAAQDQSMRDDGFVFFGAPEQR